LPYSIGKLKLLKTLNFADNHVKHLPADIGDLKELRKLYIHGNRFT